MLGGDLMLSFHYYDLLDFGVNPLVVLLIIPISIIIPLVIIRIVYSKKTYRCTECETRFKPTFLQTHLGGYHDELSTTDKGREQYCPKCQKITWCKFDESN